MRWIMDPDKWQGEQIEKCERDKELLKCDFKKCERNKELVKTESRKVRTG